ncbi:hypothetical protein AJ79_06161 [Helicocarpus griseus UAMH5409]|uniref:Uncharacterized protein n=1 Tax=Helicocarpus griseus UAMH5409 TaxID=1447875 RepID=A0A2B7XG85_9EURO|nr:hypothetical protein AJ79_06161 [Helicocarpus griseus UAMH5409]
MDEFAQTRGVDDLFDDEIIPVPTQEIEYHEDPEPQPEPEPAPPVSAPHSKPQPASSEPQPLTSQSLEQQQRSYEAAQRQEGAAGRNGGYNNRGRGNGRGYGGGGERGRGRGRGGAGRGGAGRRGGREQAAPVSAAGTVEEKVVAAAPTAAVSAEGGEQVREGKEGEVSGEPNYGGNEEGDNANLKDGEGEGEGDNGAEKKTKEQAAPRTFAVKGDRSGTGGVKKPKLTESELTERMKALKLKAAERAAAHARAEADEASFLERERIAAQKRREETANRRIMNGERERNRQRKLNAQTGREWDAEKDAVAFADSGRGRGGSMYRRGAHGGVAYDGGAGHTVAPGVEEPSLEGEGGYDASGFRGRRGGGRGQRRGRGGRGRGDYFGKQQQQQLSNDGTTGSGAATQPAPPRVNVEEEFPALPGSSGGKGPDSGSGSKDNESVTTPISPHGTWADQMEMSHSEFRAQQPQSLEATLSGTAGSGSKEDKGGSSS